jgi:signal transduction histidine kinase
MYSVAQTTFLQVPAVEEGSKAVKFLGRKILDFSDFSELAFNFGVNFLVLFIIVQLIYVPINKTKEFIFTYFVFNIVIFFLCSVMSTSNLKEGFAFGLFAVLSLLRYRTESIPTKEMTYLFISISIAVINALLNKKISILEIAFINGAIIFCVFILEKMWSKTREHTQMLVYEKIELIKPERRAELIADLQERTGLKINNIEVVKINLLTDSAIIKILYVE